MLEARTVERHAGSYKKDETFINGMPEYHVEIKEHIPVNGRLTAFKSEINLPPGWLKCPCLVFL